MELLERAEFLRTLAQYAADAAERDGRLVLLAGESGIGKTALVEAFQQELRGARWLWGACDGLLTPRPLAPLFDIAAEAGGELARLCDGGAPRDQLFAALLAGIDAPGRLTVAVIEDVHWADEATLDLLIFLGRRLRRMRTLLLVTYREDELAGQHPLRLVLGDLATQRSTRRMGLPPLSGAAVRELVGDRELDAAELRRVTGGNPFYVREILAAGWPSIPPTVRDVVGARMARATPAAREAVRVAALTGTRVEPSLLAAALPGAHSAADECLRSGFLVADTGGLRFRHELVRMAVADTIAPHRRAGIHASLLAALAETAGADPAVLAHHAEGAGDGQAVRRYAPQAAGRSAALGAHREAAAQFERALRFADPDDGPALARLHEGLAAQYSELDRWAEAQQALRTALQLRRELGDDLAVGQDLGLLSGTLWQLCRGEESEQAARESLRILRALPPGPELAEAYLNVAGNDWSVGHRAAALDAVAKAQDIGERLGRADVVSRALSSRGMLLVDLDEDGTQLIEQALAAARAARLPQPAASAYINLQDSSVSLQKLAEAQRYYAEGMASCQDRELWFYTRCLIGGQADTFLLLGRWDEAVELCERVLAIPGVSPANQLYPTRILATIHARRGGPGAWELLDSALALADGMGEQPWIAQAQAVRVELLWLSGEPGQAAGAAAAAYQRAAGRMDSWRSGALAIWLARLTGQTEFPAGLPEPYALEVAGDHAAAARAWRRLGRPYDAALAWLTSSDSDGLKDALGTLGELGARPAAAAVRRRLKELGVTAIPRGPRPATRAAPAGLTAREQEVLALLSEGLPDREISRRLFISERTVHHHVSAVLSKIGVSSRTAAAREAAKLGIRA